MKKMRILWFSVSPSLYSANGNNQGLGWISSLERIVRDDKEIELAIAFEYKDDVFKTEQNGVTYYPMNVFKNKDDIKRRKYHIDIEERLFMPYCKRVVDDFKPDVIHVFGSEWCFGLIQEHTTIPVIIHIQGSMPPYQNAMFPPGYSWWEEHDDIPWWNFRWKYRHTLWRKKSMKVVAREESILRKCKYFMGRTDWDYVLSRLYAPNSQYYKCWEALRPMFIEGTSLWKPDKKRKKYIIVSTGPSRLKGMDVILKTAKLLRQNTCIDFEWRIIGANSGHLTEHERKWSINAEKNNVKAIGVLDGDEVRKELLNCDLYVLPTYIDNSPNAVCEAMCLGVPVVSTLTGGLPSLIDNHQTGELVPCNDPYTLAYTLCTLLADTDKRIQYGRAGRDIALQRHNPEAILSTIKYIYQDIIN